jgi:hypothetical protein
MNNGTIINAVPCLNSEGRIVCMVTSASKPLHLPSMPYPPVLARGGWNGLDWLVLTRVFKAGYGRVIDELAEKSY